MKTMCAVALVCSLLTFATAAAAECTWVLWVALGSALGSEGPARLAELLALAEAETPGRRDLVH
jgi:hypothetical protein